MLFEQCNFCISIWTQENRTQGYVRQNLDIEILLMTLFRHTGTFAKQFQRYGYFCQTIFGHMGIFTQHFLDTWILLSNTFQILAFLSDAIYTNFRLFFNKWLA